MVRFLALGLLCLSLACGGSSDPIVNGGNQPKSGHPPQISNLILTPTTAELNSGSGVTTVSFMVDFSDVDSDVNQARLTYGSKSIVGGVQDGMGYSSGTVWGAVELSTASLGTTNIQLSLIDSQNNESNVLSGTFTVTEHVVPPPTLFKLNPELVVCGGPAFTLAVTGTNFFPDSKVAWNGSLRTTTYVSSSEVHAVINAADIASVGVAQVSVVNPAAEGGTSGLLPLTISDLVISEVKKVASDLVWDSKHGVIYASISTLAGGDTNGILVIDPGTATVVKTVSTGVDPHRLAISDDGQYLYAGIDQNYEIRRFLLPDMTPDITIPLGTDPISSRNYSAHDIQVKPGSPTTIAVSLGIPSLNAAADGGVVIFDNAVPRATKAPGAPHFFCSLQWDSTGSALYAANEALHRLKAVVSDCDWKSPSCG
jgi:hypothetical protein